MYRTLNSHLVDLYHPEIAIGFNRVYSAYFTPDLGPMYSVLVYSSTFFKYVEIIGYVLVLMINYMNTSEYFFKYDAVIIIYDLF